MSWYPVDSNCTGNPVATFNNLNYDVCVNINALGGAVVYKPPDYPTRFPPAPGGSGVSPSSSGSGPSLSSSAGPIIGGVVGAASALALAAAAIVIARRRRCGAAPLRGSKGAPKVVIGTPLAALALPARAGGAAAPAAAAGPALLLALAASAALAAA